MENSLGGYVAIYTFAPDGSDFTKVITGGVDPFWSPDGSQIAYRVPVHYGLSIADADGSNVRTFNFGNSGPWHPGTLEDGAGR
jgi:Tol biopolymer transport system component